MASMAMQQMTRMCLLAWYLTVSWNIDAQLRASGHKFFLRDESRQFHWEDRGQKLEIDMGMGQYL